MFGLGPATKIYVAAEAVDMRKGFEGLFGLVRDQLGLDPLSGHLFLFTNRSHTRLKALVWDGRGLWVCAKRLERGRFYWPEARDIASVSMRPEELAMLVNGMDLAQARPRRTGCVGESSGIKHFRRFACSEYKCIKHTH
jgi:transposase